LIRSPPRRLLGISAKSSSTTARATIAYTGHPRVADLGRSGSIIVNDSIFGPLQDITTTLERCDFAEADVWGMTDSYDVRYHLQSYFLIFGPAALASDCFRDFWKRVRYIGQKRSAVLLYEVGLSKALLKSGLRVKALFPYSQLVDAVLEQAMAGRPDGHALGADFFDMLLQKVNSGVPLNPTHYFWEYLITSLGFPFLKR
jgi:hypothetical protein